MKNKTILIGLDGATWNNLGKWKDKLPYFKKLLARGVYTSLLSTIPCMTCPAVPSLCTGKNPGKTGVFGFKRADGSLFTYDKLRDEAFWDVLGENDYSSLVVNLRMAFPPRIKKGVMASATMGGSTKKCNYVYPAKYKGLFRKLHGNGYDDFVDNLKKLPKTKENFALDTREKYNIFLNAYKKTSPDFAFFWDGNTDYVQHFQWHNQKEIFNYYKRLDLVIFKDLLERAKKTNIMIVSDHGFEASAKYAFYINSWLEKKKYLYFKESKFQRNTRNLRDYMYYRIGWIVKNILPIKYFNFVFRLFKKMQAKGSAQKSVKGLYLENPRTNLNIIDKKKSVAYFDQSWGIRIIKENARDYGKLKHKLKKELSGLAGFNGKPIFKEVHKKEEVYKGQFLKYLPDIVFLTEQGYEVRNGTPKKIIKRTKDKRTTTGGHSNARKAIFIALGPDIKKTGKLSKPVQIYDIAPTIIHMYDSPVPKDIDGKVLKPIFNPRSVLAQRKLKYSDSGGEKQKMRSIIDDIKI
ncbi:alkaline phosphatase family protein [Candidatus Woesearchaeota archaeon]|nr:alkaline phosphatase family protein [Candidatus Woesearchaeota archaeon]